MKTTVIYKTREIIIMVLLIVIIALSITSYSLWMKPQKTFVMCIEQDLASVQVSPSIDSQVMYVLSEHDKVWWSGARTEKWLFVYYAHGAGWIRTSTELWDCPVDAMSLQ